jgi:carboxyl-terminal processing protease
LLAEAVTIGKGAPGMRRKLGLIFLLFLVGLDLLVGGRVLTSGRADDVGQELAARLGLFTRAFQLIRQDYVDPQKTEAKDLVHAAIKQMLGKLDPHSIYLDANDFQDSQEENKGEVTGIGIVVSALNGFITIVSSVEDAPASKAGLMAGDQILAINGVKVERKTVEDIAPLLRGGSGTVVNLNVFRPSTKANLDVSVTRQIYKVTTVRDAHLLERSIAGNSKIGYLRITEFNQPTAVELGERVDELLKQGMRALVVDLRYNPGGLLQSAIDTCGVFLPPKTMVVYTEGRDPSTHQEYFTDPRSKQRDSFPIVVLVNSESASASEIVAGAMKDWRRAIIVGETTFGKGLVQGQFPLPDGSGMRLTVSRYYTPAHETIQEKGVEPDILSILSREDERALLIRRRGAFSSAAEKEQVLHAHDSQLERAVDALKGLLVNNEQQ